MPWVDQLLGQLGMDVSSAPPSYQRVNSPVEIRRLLETAIAERIDFFGGFVTPFQRQHLMPARLGQDVLDLDVIRPRSRPTSDLRLFFTVGSLTYSFPAEIRREDPTGMAVSIPEILDFGEQRHAPRWSLPEPMGTVPLVRHRHAGVGAGFPLLDFSRTGLSLLAHDAEPAFEPGERLANLELGLNGDVIHLPPVEVRNQTMLERNEGWRIGIEVGLVRKPVRVRHKDFPLWPGSETPRRRKSRPDAAGGRAVEVVRYFNRRGERIVGIVNTTFGERIDERVPVVILPPATGRRKETLSALALTIVENFRDRGKHVAVLRFDGIRRHGESTNDPEARKPGMEMVRSTMGQAIEDIHATLDYLYDNPSFKPSGVAVISMSSASIEARRAIVEDGGKRLHYWISLAGSPDFHDTLKNICGGLDLLGSHRNGVALGIVPVLGNPVDLEHFFKDAFGRRLVYLRDGLEEIPNARVPITWIYGRYDDWVRPERVKNLMSVRSPMPREVLSIPTGHQMRTSEEAMEGFKLVTACLWKFFQGSHIRPFAPDAASLIGIREAEKARLARRQDGDHLEFWREYLERREEYLGFDIIRGTDAYRHLTATQLDLLDLEGGERILDAGCGTGNFVESLITRALEPDHPLPMPHQVTLADYVPQGLETARGKLERLAGGARVPLPEFTYRVVDLECSRFLPVAEALAGGGYRWDRLRGVVQGLTPALLDRLGRESDADAVRMARGEDPEGAKAMAASRGKEAAEILDDLGRAARFVKGALVPADFKAPGRADPAPYDMLTAADLKWNRLAFGRAGRTSGLPFEEGAFDRIISSLVVCYLFRPQATIAQFHRILAPGGVLVISSMKPDADVSRIYMRLIDRLQSSEEVEIPEGLTREDLLNSARAFLNKAAGILNLEEDGAFEFLPREALVRMLGEAGFRDIRVIDTFGDPPQAYALSGRRS